MRPLERWSRLAKVIYRMRIYDAVPEHLDAFHELFRRHLLPVQLRHGARLVGRWETEDGRVVAVWEYDDAAAAARIDQAVATDPESLWSQSRQGALPPLFRGYEDVLMRSTTSAAMPPAQRLPMPSVN